MHYNTIKELEDIATHYINASCLEVCKLTDLHDFDLAFSKLDWSKRRTSSRGGWYPKQGGAGVSIAMYPTSKDTKGEIIRVYEYASFDSSTSIGGFYTRNREDKIAMHCLHEVAHAAQYWGYYLKKIDPGDPHGSTWKNIYSHLRRNILNPRLEPQDALKKEYNNYIESIESQFVEKVKQMIAASK